MIPADYGYFGMIGLMAVCSFFIAAFTLFWNAAITSGDMFHNQWCHWRFIDRLSYMFLGFAITGQLFVLQFNIFRVDALMLFSLFIGFHIHKYFLWHILGGDDTSVAIDVAKGVRHALSLDKKKGGK